MKLTKAQRKRHELAVELIHSYEPGKHRDAWIECPYCHGAEGGCDECPGGQITAADFIFDAFHPGAFGRTDIAATFFTPRRDARSVAQAHGGTGRVLEPTAGIGVCAHALMEYLDPFNRRAPIQLVCVEIVKDFVEIGRRLVPEADWICGNIFDVLPTLGRFDTAIGNPPFGNIPTNQSTTFRSAIHFGILDAVIPMTEHGGVFILPRNSVPQADGEEGPANYRRFRNLHRGWEIQRTSWQLTGGFKCTGAQCDIFEVARIEGYEPGQEEPEQEEKAAVLEQPTQGELCLAA
jgi:hypothetical protein